ncbi:hypothetical protein CLAIMM_11948 [Cladophialophora immunda]|nr:hypothetical protein CLAIMM_11948 [Cladophialophora immunda]
MLVSLVTEKWKWAETWFWETIGLEKLAPITQYQIAPTVENYWKIQPGYRPTQLQMSRFHWPALDWIPFAEIRDKLIMHGNEIDLTDVILTAMQSYCLEVPDEPLDIDMPSADLTALMLPLVPTPQASRPHTTTLYRLREYIDHLNVIRTSKGPSTASSHRARMSKSLEARFVLTLSDINAPFKLEQSFFDQFPLLFCEEAVARGTFRSIYDTN